MKPSRISRIMRILTALQSGRSCNVDELARISGTCRRTVFRDLKELDAVGVPYRFDACTGGYVVDPEYFLPPVNLNLHEALGVLLFVHKTADQMQLPFKNSAMLAAMKIENVLPVKVRRHCNTTLRNISTRLAPGAPMSSKGPKADNSALVSLFDTVFEKLQKAIRRKRKVGIRYRSLFEKKIIDVILCPYHLMYNQRAWYVLGLSELHKSVRTFKLNRIEQLEMLDKCFLDEDGFDVYEYLGKAWSMIPQGRIYNVKLRFLPKVAENVTEVHWHSTQQVTRRSDGSAIMEFRVDGLGEIIWWILGYGDQVQVLAPKILRDRVCRVARNVVRLNQYTRSAGRKAQKEG